MQRCQYLYYCNHMYRALHTDRHFGKDCRYNQSLRSCCHSNRSHTSPVWQLSRSVRSHQLILAHWWSHPLDLWAVLWSSLWWSQHVQSLQCARWVLKNQLFLLNSEYMLNFNIFTGCGCQWVWIECNCSIWTLYGHVHVVVGCELCGKHGNFYRIHGTVQPYLYRLSDKLFNKPIVTLP